MGQIEKGCTRTQQRAEAAVATAEAIQVDLVENRRRISGLVSGVESSLDSTVQSRNQMAELEKRSREIDKIVDAITTVSIQTNMLAVNGSIEAARAGEFGKGFAVVSTDIRNLAQESAENADRIKVLVKSIQDQVGVVRDDLEEITTAARAEVVKNAEIEAKLEQVAVDMSEVLEGNKLIQESSESILAQVQTVRLGVEQISAAAEQANRSAGEAGQASAEQARGANQLSAAIEQIASMADELQAG